MRLTTVILIASLIQVSAAGFAQKITLNQHNYPLESILKEIRKQSGYDYYFDSKFISKGQKASISVQNAGIDEALDEALEGLSLSYEIDGRIISIKKKEPSLFDKAVSAFTTVDILGIVLDEKAEPLIGATIRIKNSGRVITSNPEGKFGFRRVEEGAVLIISYMGYKSKEVVIGKVRFLTIKLSPWSEELDSVTVMSTGYQSLSKERATGSFNTVSEEQLDKPATNIAQRLIGTTAGMQATLDGEGNPRFEIRGQTTLNNKDVLNRYTANALPLVVVDGFAIQGDFSTINPNDIESVTILKDAAAASIWGARSANGVIVITTKKAKKNESLKVGFSAFTRMANKLDLDYVNPLASSSETVDYEMKAFGNWGAMTNPGSLSYQYFQWSPATVALNEFRLGFISAAERDARLATYRSQSNKGQISDELLTNPFTQQYNLGLSGSSGKMSNIMSLLYEDNKSNFKGTDNEKYTVNYRTTADAFKWLQVSFSAMLNYNKVNNNGLTLGEIQNISPYEMLRNEDGSLTDISKYYTPILQRFVPTSLFPYANWSYNPIEEIANRKVTSEQLNARLQGGLKFKIAKGLSFDTKAQYELFNTSNKGIYNENTFQVRNAVNTAASWNQATNKITLNLPKGGLFTQNRTRAETYNVRTQLNFDRKFNDKHELNVVAGSEINDVVSETFGNPNTYGYSEETLSVGTFPNGPGGSFFPIKNWLGSNEVFPYVNSYTYNVEKYFSMFGNAAYTFNNKYTVSGSVRTDASNLITDDPSYRYAPFWSVGLGWQASNESFMRDVSWVDRLNIRATYGFNGNVDRSTSFMPLIAVQSTPNTYTGDNTASIASFGNPTLRWERTGTWNTGLDFSLLKGQLYGKIDAYNKSGKDLIATLSIPAVNGTTSQKLNNAKMTNKGIELELGTTQNIKGNAIVWHGNINFSYNKNRITDLFIATYSASSLAGGGSGAYVQGQDANTQWRYSYAGIQNNEPMVYGPDGVLYDLNTTTPGDGRNYLVNTGTAVAPYTLGFINAFQVYDFNISFIVTGKFGHVFRSSGFNYPVTWSMRTLPNNKLSQVMNGDPSRIVPLPLNLNEPRYNNWTSYTGNMSYLMESASHLRMQEVNVSYNIPTALLSRIRISRLQVFAQGNDLFTIVANKEGEDPEYPIGQLKPQPRLSLGIKCEF